MGRLTVSLDSRELDRFTPGRAFARFDDDADVVTTVEGSLGFVDISGFTALSERLAALGRVGAEELTEVLGRVFGEMIDLASGRGGTLLKFGGDALLLLYESDDHALQAASAAVEMRAALRKAVEIPTSVGKVALRMSQGVHSGEIQLIRSRGVHTELVVAGPAVSYVTEMEGSADASEIVVSDATLALLPRDAATDRKGAGWLLRWRTPRIDPCGFIGMDSGMGGDADLVPTALREHLASGATESEHRQATVAFVEVVGIDDAIAERGAFPAAADLASLIASIGSIADDEGVTFLATDVDENACKVILVAGVPVTEIDEEGRMLRAVRRIADLDSSFGVKIGVNRGHVFSGEVGSSHRATYTIMGDTVNLAARMMAAAPAGSIYVSPGVVDRSRTVYETSEVEPFHVKGRTAPVRAYSMGSEIGLRTREAAEEGVFVGREDELEHLRALVQAAAAGEGASVVISGPTGIGKTRLVDELIDEVDSPVVEVRAEPYGSANPYRPFRDPVRELLGVERGSNDAMAAALIDGLADVAPNVVPFAPLIADIAHIDVPPTPETAPIEGRFRQERTADIVIDLLRSAFPDSMVLVAEDMHWADAASEALLGRILRESSRESWLAVVTGRDYSIPDAYVLDLAPLADDAVTQLVHAETEAAPLRPDVVSAVVERAGGSPLFAQELVHAVRDTGDASSLPTSLDGVVGSQIDGLAPLPRRVLRYASVLGRSFRTSVARDLIATQGIQLDAATRSTLAGFLDNDGDNRLQFRHAMVRDVAYEGLAYRKRKELHLSAGRLLLDRFVDVEESVADILALHFFEGGDAERAWRFCRMAGDHSMEMYANVEAATQYERALEATGRLIDIADGDRRDVWIKLGDVRERSGRFAEAFEAYRRATAFSGDDPIRKAQVLLKRARAKERSGSYSSALTEASRARRLVESRRDSDAMGLLAKSFSYSAMIRQAQEKPKRALEAAITASEYGALADDDLACARAWKIMDWAYHMLGEPDKAVYSQRALEVYRDAGDLDEEGRVAINIGAIAYFGGDWERAVDYYELGRDAATRAGSTVDTAIAAANTGEVLVNQGLWEEAREPLDAARRIYAASGFGEGVAWADQLLGRLHGLEGDLEESVAKLRASVDVWNEVGMAASAFEASIYLADAVCRSGDPSDGLRLLMSAKDVAPAEYLDHYATVYARIHGSVLNAVGRREEAAAVLEAGVAVAEENQEVYEGALLTLTLEQIDSTLVDLEAVTSARGTLRALGVQRVPGVSL